MSRTVWNTVFDVIAPLPTGGAVELSAERIALQIRWFGLAVGVLLANFTVAAEAWYLNGILLVGLAFTTADTLFTL